MRDVNITHFPLARGLQQSYSLVMTTNENMKRLQNLQDQIIVMGMTGSISAERVMYCTAERWTLAEVEATLAYLSATGIITRNPVAE